MPDNRVLTLPEVLALPGGAEVYFEFRDKGTPELHDLKVYAPMESLLGAFGPKARDEYNVYWRVWLREPTGAERDVAKWES